MAWRVISSIGGTRTSAVWASMSIWLIGTATTYAQVTRLLALLDVNLSMADAHFETVKRRLKPGHDEHGDGQTDRENGMQSIEYRMTTKYQDVILPELSVAAAWVMVMKMLYGLDGEPRSVISVSRHRV